MLLQAQDAELVDLRHKVDDLNAQLNYAVEKLQVRPPVPNYNTLASVLPRSAVGV